MFDKPKPCPFCGGKNPIIVRDVQYPDTPNARTWYAVECNVCDATGDWDLGESGAIAKWNTRPVEDALRADMREWQEAATKSYGECCGTDERHCTCVPLLRVEIERLRAENEVYLARITKLNGELYDAHNVIDTYKNDPTKALREIGYHDVEGFYSMEGKDEPE